MPARRYMLSPQGGGAVPPPVLRRFFKSNYTAISQSQSGTIDGSTFIGVPDAGPVALVGGHWQAVSPGTFPRSASSTPCAPNTAAVNCRIYWKDIDNDDGTYKLDWIEKMLAQCATFNPPVALFLTIVSRTFNGNGTLGDGTDPAPPSFSHLAGANQHSWPFVAGTGTSSSGYQIARWNASTVLPAYQRMVSAVGAAFDSNPLFAGIGTQETSVGVGVGTDAFSGPTYLAGLNLESDYISAACPHGRHLAFMNFMGPGITNAQATAYLLQYAAHISDNGAILAGPDLTTGAVETSSGSGVATPSTPAAPATGGIISRCYPVYNAYHFGNNGVPRPGPTGCSIQSAEYIGGTPYSPPADFFVNFFNLFNYATSSAAYPNSGASAGALAWVIGSQLNVDILIWDYRQGGAHSFFPDATDIIAAQGSYGNYVPV